MQAETALGHWRKWGNKLRSRPILIRSLSGGRSNRSFLLDADGTRMVLRINGPDSLLPGADRVNETTIWRAASEQGIAPPLLYVDEQMRYLVSAYINNSLPPQPAFNEGFVDLALELLNRYHQLEVNTPAIDYVSHIEHYWQIIENKAHLRNPALHRQRKPMNKLLETLLSSETETGLCHHDPVVANFVGNSDRLYLIDWEYASHGLLLMDYAALAVEWGIDDTTLLTKTGVEPELLAMAKTLYNYLYTLWEEITG